MALWRISQRPNAATNASMTAVSADPACPGLAASTQPREAARASSTVTSLPGSEERGCAFELACAIPVSELAPLRAWRPTRPRRVRNRAEGAACRRVRDTARASCAPSPEDARRSADAAEVIGGRGYAMAGKIGGGGEWMSGNGASRRARTLASAIRGAIRTARSQRPPPRSAKWSSRASPRVAPDDAPEAMPGRAERLSSEAAAVTAHRACDPTGAPSRLAAAAARGPGRTSARKRSPSGGRGEGPASSGGTAGHHAPPRSGRRDGQRRPGLRRAGARPREGASFGKLSRTTYGAQRIHPAFDTHMGSARQHHLYYRRVIRRLTIGAI